MNQDAPIFSASDLQQVDLANIPKHIAIIPDGNRRWAKSHSVSTQAGHGEGYENVVRIVRAAKELGVKVITLYAFSTENWKRSDAETEQLMQLTRHYLLSYQQKLINHNMRLSAIGRLDGLPPAVKETLDETIKRTATCSEFDLVLAINYGGRDEIVRAISRLLHEKIKVEEISEETITQHLDTRFWPDPDLLIRTSGEKRLSNFLLWQTSYAEVYVDDVVWPDFTPTHLIRAVRDYQMRERRLGGYAYK